MPVCLDSFFYCKTFFLVQANIFMIIITTVLENIKFRIELNEARFNQQYNCTKRTKVKKNMIKGSNEDFCLLDTV